MLNPIIHIFYVVVFFVLGFKRIVRTTYSVVTGKLQIRFCFIKKYQTIKC